MMSGGCQVVDVFLFIHVCGCAQSLLWRCIFCSLHCLCCYLFDITTFCFDVLVLIGPHCHAIVLFKLLELACIFVRCVCVEQISKHFHGCTFVVGVMLIFEVVH